MKPERDALAEKITANWISQAIYVACKLEIADRLAGGPCSIDDLATACDCDADSLFRVLRALSSIGIFEETQDRCFGLTSQAEYLKTDSSESLRPLALLMGSEIYHTFGHLLHSVKTGEIAFDAVYGQPYFDYLSDHPEAAAVFDAAMSSSHGHKSEAIIDAYNFSDFPLIADIGGGNGSTLAAILERNPNSRGVLFDLPHVVERARQQFESCGLAERCSFVGGNFFDSIPAGADLYLLRHILHDWNDERAQQILTNCANAMSRDSHLVAVDGVIPPGNDPMGTKLLDLTMMLIPGGRERTKVEFQTIYEKAGLKLERILPTQHEISLIEGKLET